MYVHILVLCPRNIHQFDYKTLPGIPLTVSHSKHICPISPLETPATLNSKTQLALNILNKGPWTPMGSSSSSSPSSRRRVWEEAGQLQVMGEGPMLPNAAGRAARRRAGNLQEVVTFHTQLPLGHLWLKQLEQPRKRLGASFPSSCLYEVETLHLPWRSPTLPSQLQSEAGHRFWSPWQPLQSVSARSRRLLLKLKEGEPSHI